MMPSKCSNAELKEETNIQATDNIRCAGEYKNEHFRHKMMFLY